MTSWVAGTRSAPTVKKLTRTDGKSCGSRPNTLAALNTAGVVVMRDSVRDSVPTKGSCAAPASGAGANAAFEFSGPVQCARCRSRIDGDPELSAPCVTPQHSSDANHAEHSTAVNEPDAPCGRNALSFKNANTHPRRWYAGAKTSDRTGPKSAYPGRD